VSRRSPPTVSVVIAVHNGEEFVADSVKSILNQTLADLELIVVDDGSSDASAAEVRRVADDRVEIVELRQPSGDLAIALDEGVKRCRAELIARMDADDISLPTRLERQVAVMTGDPALAMAGSWVEALDAKGEQWMVSRPPVDDTSIRFILNFRCPFHHPSMILRRSSLQAAGGYRTGYRYAEDYDLWRRMIKVGRAINLPEVLVAQRYYSASTSGRNRKMQQARSDDIGMEMLESALGKTVPPDVVAMLRDQDGPTDLRKRAGRILFELYGKCMGTKDYPDTAALQGAACKELLDLANHPGASRSAPELWANAFRIDRRAALRRAQRNTLERLRGLRRVVR
jgi:Glycosyl transferase family 2